MTRHSVLMALFGLALAVVSAAQAADAPAKNDKPAKAGEPAKPAIEVIAVTIHPAAEPKPALKYHLLPTFLESTPGDAMPLYAKALIEHVRTWTRISDDSSKVKEYGMDHLNEWQSMPLDKLPRDRVRKLVDSFGGMVKGYLELAVRREHCHWEMPLRQGHVFEMLLPEVQEFRSMARIVALRARLQMAVGKYADAIDSLQTGYGMARQIAEQPFLVSGLVGLAIATMMNDQLLTLCQQPGAPNLYWSIAALPDPLFERNKVIEAEYDGLFLQWPELQAARHAQYAPEQWNILLRRTVLEIIHFDDPKWRRMSEKERTAEIEKMIARAFDAIPRAKQGMIATGHTQKDLDAMAPAQIVILYSLETYEKLRDDSFKWWRLPYWQAHKGMEAADRAVEAAKNQELIPMASVVLPAASSAMFAFARTDRQLAAIRCIEALRIYAAAHHGELPATLDDIKEVPIPLNPVTGKPFPYHLEGKTAVLDAEGGLTNTPRPQYRVSVASP